MYTYAGRKLLEYKLKNSPMTTIKQDSL